VLANCQNMLSFRFWFRVELISSVVQGNDEIEVLKASITISIAVCSIKNGVGIRIQKRERFDRNVDYTLVDQICAS
jgi:hypothetical protein